MPPSDLNGNEPAQQGATRAAKRPPPPRQSGGPALPSHQGGSSEFGRSFMTATSAEMATGLPPSRRHLLPPWARTAMGRVHRQDEGVVPTVGWSGGMGGRDRALLWDG